MDPNEALKRCRALGAQVLRNVDDGVLGSRDTAEALAEAFAALDSWLAKGGFLPKSWSHSHPYNPTLHKEPRP